MKPRTMSTATPRTLAPSMVPGDRDHERSRGGSSLPRFSRSCLALLIGSSQKSLQFPRSYSSFPCFFLHRLRLLGEQLVDRGLEGGEGLRSLHAGDGRDL